MTLIAISAGHHQKAQGASFEGITEYHLATAWANQIVQILGDKAIRVPNGTLREKVAFINNTPDVTIAAEIHFNSDPGRVGKGSETLYMPGSEKGKAAAMIVQDAIGHIMKPNRGAKEGYYQMNPAKGPDFFLRKVTNCTPLIIEPEFIANLDVITNNMFTTCHAIAGALLEIQV